MMRRVNDFLDKLIFKITVEYFPITLACIVAFAVIVMALGITVKAIGG
jgi:hypothetical protein